MEAAKAAAASGVMGRSVPSLQPPVPVLYLPPVLLASVLTWVLMLMLSLALLLPPSSLQLVPPVLGLRALRVMELIAAAGPSGLVHHARLAVAAAVAGLLHPW